MTTLRDSRQTIHSIAFSCRPKSLCMNTLRDSSQSIHSIILRGKVLRTKKLWGGPVQGLRFWLLTGFQRPTPSRARGVVSGAGVWLRPTQFNFRKRFGRRRKRALQNEGNPNSRHSPLGCPVLKAISRLQCVWPGHRLVTLTCRERDARAAEKDVSTNAIYF